MSGFCTYAGPGPEHTRLVVDNALDAIRPCRVKGFVRRGTLRSQRLIHCEEDMSDALQALGSPKPCPGRATCLSRSFPRTCAHVVRPQKFRACVYGRHSFLHPQPPSSQASAMPVSRLGRRPSGKQLVIIMVNSASLVRAPPPALPLLPHSREVLTRRPHTRRTRHQHTKHPLCPHKPDRGSPVCSPRWLPLLALSLLARPSDTASPTCSLAVVPRLRLRLRHLRSLFLCSNSLIRHRASAARRKPRVSIFDFQLYVGLTRIAEFTKCLEKADLPSCTWYLEQLKAVRSPLV